MAQLPKEQSGHWAEYRMQPLSSRTRTPSVLSLLTTATGEPSVFTPGIDAPSPKKPLRTLPPTVREDSVAVRISPSLFRAKATGQYQ